MESLFGEDRPVHELSPGEREWYRLLFIAHQDKYPDQEIVLKRLTDRDRKPIHSITYKLVQSLLKNHSGCCVIIPDRNGNPWRVWVEFRSDGSYFRGMVPENSEK